MTETTNRAIKIELSTKAIVFSFVLGSFFVLRAKIKPTIVMKKMSKIRIPLTTEYTFIPITSKFVRVFRIIKQTMSTTVVSADRIAFLVLG
ncbi:hypothetical protein [Psychroserpens mesophilus]|jgi:hypothetical protein|uniref:hypothetical protein n=1 Tax=Psychroserpens mesophilus TaxID=325473 RepID=UPI003F493123